MASALTAFQCSNTESVILKPIKEADTCLSVCVCVLPA